MVIQLNDEELTQQLLERLPELDLFSNPIFQCVRKKAAKQRFLLQLLRQSFRGSHRHANSNIGHDSFSYQYLRKHLGDDYKRYLTPFYDFPVDNSGYAKERQLTKKYRLKPDVRETIESAHHSCSESAKVITKKGRTLKRHELPKNGITGSYSTISVPSVVPIDPAVLDETIAQVLEVIAPLRESARHADRLERTLAQLLEARRWITTLGGIPNLYRQFSNGRLGAKHPFHLINVTREARLLLLRGQGLYDYDFSAAHLTILRDLANGYGCKTPTLDDFLEDRQVLYQFIEETFEIPPEDSKRFLLSFIYGAELPPNPHSENTEMLGYENQRILSQFPEIEQIHQEIREAGKVVIKKARTAATRDGRVTLNVLGLPTAETRIAKRLSHLLMGYEALMLDSICRDLDDISCVIYDGWIGRDQDVTRLEEKIEVQSTQELGFPIKLQIKKRNIPGTVDEVLELCGHLTSEIPGAKPSADNLVCLDPGGL